MFQTFWQTAIANAAFAAALCLVLVPLARLIGRPALTHAVCLIVLLKFLTPPLWTFTLSGSEVGVKSQRPLPGAALTPPGKAAVNGNLTSPVFSAYAPPSSEPQLGETLGPAMNRPMAVPAEIAAPAVPYVVVSEPVSLWRQATANVPLTSLAGAVWGAAILASVGVMARRIWTVRKLLKFVESGPDYLQRRTKILAAQIGLTTAPPVQFIPGRSCPMLLALFGPPRLLVPVNLWRRLTPDQQDTLLLHELAHYRRRDHWVRYIELAATAAYWWHPMLWWCRRELREAEEQCCDAWVVWAQPAGARTYAMTLLDTADWAMNYAKTISAPASLPVLASGMSLVKHLERRIVMIKQASAPRSLGWQGLALAAGLAAAALCVSPGLAQPAPEAQPAPAATPAPPAPPQARNEGASEAPSAYAPKSLDVYTDAALAGGVEKAIELSRAQAEISHLDSQLRQARYRLAELYRKSGNQIAAAEVEPPPISPSALSPAEAPQPFPALAPSAGTGLPGRPGASATPPMAMVGAGGMGGSPQPKGATPPLAIVGSIRLAPSAGDSNEREARLDRLERQLEAMLMEVRSLRDAAPGPVLILPPDPRGN